MRFSSKRPLVSVAMSVYNGARFLDQAINSICNQTYRNFEFVIVDDGSTDATAEILARHAAEESRIRVLSQQNRGLIDSLHRGFAAATGTYIARRDDDDRAKPKRFEMQVNFLATGGEVERPIWPASLPSPSVGFLDSFRCVRLRD